MLVVFWVNPNTMIIGVTIIAVNTPKCFSTIIASQQRITGNKNDVRIQRRNTHRTKIIAIGKIHTFQVFVVGFLPALAGIVASVKFSANNRGIVQTRIGIGQFPFGNIGHTKHIVLHRLHQTIVGVFFRIAIAFEIGFEFVFAQRQKCFFTHIEQVFGIQLFFFTHFFSLVILIIE